MAKKVIPIILILGIIGTVGYFNVKNKNGQEDGLLYGTVEATQVKLSAEVMGQVLEVSAQEGDTIAKGQVLVKIDDKTLKAQLAQAKALRIAAGGQYQAVKATINNVDTNLVRSENLLDVGSISEQQFDMVDTQKKTLAGQKQAAWGQIKQAEATADLVKIQIDKATIASPIAGVVLQRNIEPGEMVMPGSALLTLADLENCWVRIYVPETDLGKIKLGQKVKLYSDSYPNKHYNGKITMVASEAEFTPKNVQTKKERVRLVYAVKVSVPNPDGELKIGMPVDAEIVE